VGDRQRARAQALAKVLVQGTLLGVRQVAGGRVMVRTLTPALVSTVVGLLRMSRARVPWAGGWM
jgi:hypothetical protein